MRLFFMLLEMNNKFLWAISSSSFSAPYAVCNGNPFINFGEGIDTDKTPSLRVRFVKNNTYISFI
jgi:hypothetical protein